MATVCWEKGNKMYKLQCLIWFSFLLLFVSANGNVRYGLGARGEGGAGPFANIEQKLLLRAAGKGFVHLLLLRCLFFCQSTASVVEEFYNVKSIFFLNPFRLL